MSPARPSPFAHGLLLAGGTAWIFALFVAISAATDQRFEIAGAGTDRGIPLPSSWFHSGLFAAIGAALWILGRQWGRPGFVALRARRPWLVPTIAALVVLPASLALIFVLVQ